MSATPRSGGQGTPAGSGANTPKETIDIYRPIANQVSVSLPSVCLSGNVLQAQLTLVCRNRSSLSLRPHLLEPRLQYQLCWA